MFVLLWITHVHRSTRQKKQQSTLLSVGNLKCTVISRLLYVADRCWQTHVIPFQAAQPVVVVVEEGGKP